MKFNLNKLFPFLSIRTKLIIAFTLLSFIPLAVVGLIGLYHNINTLEQRAFEQLTHDVTILRERATNFMQAVQMDVHYLSNSPVFIQFLERYYQQKDVQKHYQLVTREFLTFLQTKRIYYRLHFVDRQEDEILRIQFRQGKYVVVPSSELSMSHFRFYFLLTDSLTGPQLACTPVELLDPRGGTVPAMSYAVRVYSPGGEFWGILIVDVFARDLFQVIEYGSHLDSHHRIAIVNGEGHYLYHSEKKKNWSRLLATRETQTLTGEYSPEFSRAILSYEPGIVAGPGDVIAAHAPLLPAPFSGGSSYFLFESVEKSFVLGPANRFALVFISLLLIFLAISISAGLVATGQLAGPIRQLQRGARIIARGNYDYRLNIDTNDEIEQLAHQFNQMAQAIRDREIRLEEQQKRLEEMVSQRTAELRREKEKLQAILDNVPSAFLLLDEECNILSASAAIRSITGHDPDQAVGQKCYHILSQTSICDDCMAFRSPHSPRIHSFVDSRADEDGKEVYIEHISVPIVLNNNKRAFLEILTDITERKKLEEHLIQTERLAATGEMAAVIAHEIRNSLTSVKMILQLQREAPSPLKDNPSLEVALNSLYRVEKVITTLLQFARPAPFRFQPANLNQIIGECTEFLLPQLEKRNIEVRRKLDPKVPEMEMDVEHMREALINLLLNAIQAVEQNGHISIACAPIRLNRRLEDFLVTVPYPSDQANAGARVVLSRGTRVVRLVVEDDGPGIPPEHQPQVFDPFFTTKVNGTGLGLTTVKRTVNQHGGIIRLKSSPGKGTRFEIYLPINKALHHGREDHSGR
ncbi:MAG: HAMP domain-containing protein [Calditrichaeota bacterium]|nr:MAG: HAMP domain-containing protein [Calditrichota bacterium]